MRLLLMILLVLPACPGMAQVELSLQTCRKMAVESSKKIAIADRQLMKAGYDKKAYRANFFPKLSAMGMYAYMQKDYSFKIDGGLLPVVGADGKPAGYAYMPDIHLTMGLDNAYTVGGILEQPVYMGGKVRTAFKMASIGTEMAELDVKYNHSEVITEADEAYWQCVKLKELVLSAQKYREVVNELVKNLTDARQTGMASQNDLLKAQVKYNEVELMLQKAQNGQRLAAMNLCRLIGLDLNTAVQVSDTLEENLTVGVLDGNGDIETRPEYNILDKDIELKKKQVELMRSDFLPQLGVMVSYGYTDGVAMNGEATGVASFVAMASLKVPVFHWNEGRNKVRAMKTEQEVSELKKEDMSQMMQLEASRGRFNVEDAVGRVGLTHKSLIQAKENLTVSKNRYEVGMETLTNYMEAQAQWQKAWSDWIDAKAELRLSETHYLKATGRLPK